MLKQMPLDLELRGERLEALWRQMPERCRKDALEILARFIAEAAQAATKDPGGKP